MPTVTRLARAGERSVHIEIDGASWRTIPSHLIDGIGIAVGAELTRPLLRTLRRELRRHDAATHAERILSAADTSTAKLAVALDRRGVAPADRDSLIDQLHSTGLVSDARASQTRAALLAARGYGNASIDYKLETEGYGASDRQQAIELLDDEVARAREALARKERSPQQAARFLAQRGFDAEVCEAVVPVPEAEF